jgi:hypothetical protein
LPYYVDFGFDDYFSQIWIPCLMKASDEDIKRAKALDTKLRELCTYFGPFEMGHRTDNIDEATAIREKAIELVISYLPSIAKEDLEHDFPIFEIKQ